MNYAERYVEQIEARNVLVHAITAELETEIGHNNSRGLVKITPERIVEFVLSRAGL